MSDCSIFLFDTLKRIITPTKGKLFFRHVFSAHLVTKNTFTGKLQLSLIAFRKKMEIANICILLTRRKSEYKYRLRTKKIYKQKMPNYTIDDLPGRLKDRGTVSLPFYTT